MQYQMIVATEIRLTAKEVIQVLRGNLTYKDSAGIDRPVPEDAMMRFAKDNTFCIVFIPEEPTVQESVSSAVSLKAQVLAVIKRHPTGVTVRQIFEEVSKVPGTQTSVRYVNTVVYRLVKEKKVKQCGYAPHTGKGLAPKLWCLR